MEPAVLEREDTKDRGSPNFMLPSVMDSLHVMATESSGELSVGHFNVHYVHPTREWDQVELTKETS